MARVCLVRPLLSPSDFNGYPLNLLILGSALREAAHDVRICDFDLLKEMDPTWANGSFAERAARVILESRPEFIGITAMCSNYALALDLAEELKRCAPSLHITFGGPHVSLCASETLRRYPYVDTAVIGEGEDTYPELIYAVLNCQQLSEVAGIVYRIGKEVLRTDSRKLMTDLDLSPVPAYDLVDMKSYIAAAGDTYFEVYAGSGCPFECSFCSTSIVWQRRYRTKSARRVADEVAFLYETYGVSAVNLIHDNLSSNRKFVLSVADEIRRRHIPIRWGFSSRVDTIDEGIVKAVVAAGCDYVFFGIESGSERTQRSMGKRLKLDRAHEALSTCLDNGIRPTTSFILGFPEEDEEDIERTIRLAFECRSAGARRSFINLLSAYTGTPIMQRHLARMRFLPEAANSTMVTFLERKHFTLIAQDPEIFSNYYSLDYSESPLDALEYLNLVDFYTICLFRYPSLIAYLFCTVGVGPLAVFRILEAHIGHLDPDERNRLALEITPRDARALAGNCWPEACSLLEMDNALWATRNSNGEVLLTECKVTMASAPHIAVMSPSDRSHFYLMGARGDGVFVQELSPDCFHLYAAQGLRRVQYRTEAQQSFGAGTQDNASAV